MTMQPEHLSAEKPHLKANGLAKRYGHVEALRGVNFEVRRGEVMALVGDNGAGKSTLMRSLAGASSCDDGTFEMDGQEISLATPNDAARHGIQIVYQDLALCDNLSVSANLFLGQELTRDGPFKFLPRFVRPLDRNAMEGRSRKALDQLSVKTLTSVHTEVSALSGGQRQAIAIARAIKGSASVILLDEPTAALGVSQTAEVLRTVRSLRDSGCAVVYISHNLKDVFAVSDRITVMRLGKDVGIWEANQTTPEEIVVAMTSGQMREEEAKDDA